MNKEISSPTNTKERMRERAGMMLSCCGSIALCIALPIVRQAVAYPKIKTIQSIIATITSDQYSASSYISGDPKINSPPIVLHDGCGSPAIAVFIPIICPVAGHRLALLVFIFRRLCCDACFIARIATAPSQILFWKKKPYE
jgi:hypothetical protein